MNGNLILGKVRLVEVVKAVSGIVDCLVLRNVDWRGFKNLCLEASANGLIEIFPIKYVWGDDEKENLSGYFYVLADKAADTERLAKHLQGKARFVKRPFIGRPRHHEKIYSAFTTRGIAVEGSTFYKVELVLNGHGSIGEIKVTPYYFANYLLNEQPAQSFTRIGDIPKDLRREIWPTYDFLKGLVNNNR